MKILMLAAAVLLTADAAETDDYKSPLSRDVVVCIDGMLDPRVREATRIATAIFEESGVNLEWRRLNECPVAWNAIHVSSLYETPKRISTGALAYAFPTEGTRIVILQDRLNASTNFKAGYQRTFAYVLVHEITHILQGFCHHSTEGIMKARWSPEDFYSMIDQSLSFTAFDIELIYAGLDSRYARAQKLLSNGP